MSLDLRPLSLGELLDRAFSLFRRHFWLFVGLMAIPSAFTLLIAIGMELLQRAPGTAVFSPDGDPSMVAAAIIGATVAFIAVFVGYSIAYMVTLGATTVAVSDLYVGRPATIGGSYSRMRGMTGRLMLLMLFIALRLFGMFVILLLAVLIPVMLFAVLAATGGRSPAAAAAGAVIGMVGTFGAMIATAVFSLRYSVAVPALVLENGTAGDSIRRSVELTRGSRWRAGVLVLFALVITYAAMAIFQGPFIVGAMAAGPESTTAFWLQLAGAVTGTIGGAVTGSLMIIALALLYYDIRIRKEGLDMQLMLSSLDAEPAPQT